MDEQYEVASFGLEEIEDMREIEKRHNEVLYPALSFCGNGQIFYANKKALSRITENRVTAFKAKIRGDYYVCFRGTAKPNGYVLTRNASGGATIASPTIIDAIGLPRDFHAYAKPCVFIPNGFAMKIN